LYTIIAVVVVVIVIGAVAAVLLGGMGNQPAATATPTPPPTINVAGATNLTFTASVTSQGVTTDYKWFGENIHSNAPILRLDFATYAYILDAGQQKSWMSTDSGATWTAGVFATDWTSWSPQWTDYLNNLANWTGSGNVSFTNTNGEAIVLSNIAVDQAIPSSTFAVS
jgi:hypothetical protein